MAPQVEVSAKVDASDPRPRLLEKDGEWFVAGYVCDSCGYRLSLPRPWCPTCRGPLSERLYGPNGRIWACTIVRVPLADREPPVSFAYVDLEDGPRVLCHVENDAPEPRPLAPETSVRLVGKTAQGDPLVRSSDD